jgi:hypothetical protein
VDNLGQIDLDEEVKKRNKLMFVPNWFTVDVTTAMLSIHLDEHDALASWISGRDMDVIEGGNFRWRKSTKYLQHDGMGSSSGTLPLSSLTQKINHFSQQEGSVFSILRPL